MKGNKFLAAVLAASMAFSAVPVTAMNVFANVTFADSNETKSCTVNGVNVADLDKSSEAYTIYNAINSVTLTASESTKAGVIAKFQTALTALADHDSITRKVTDTTYASGATAGDGTVTVTSTGNGATTTYVLSFSTNETGDVSEPEAAGLEAVFDGITITKYSNESVTVADVKKAFDTAFAAAKVGTNSYFSSGQPGNTLNTSDYVVESATVSNGTVTGKLKRVDSSNNKVLYYTYEAAVVINKDSANDIIKGVISEAEKTSYPSFNTTDVAATTIENKIKSDISDLTDGVVSAGSLTVGSWTVVPATHTTSGRASVTINGQPALFTLNHSSIDKMAEAEKAITKTALKGSVAYNNSGNTIKKDASTNIAAAAAGQSITYKIFNSSSTFSKNLQAKNATKAVDAESVRAAVEKAVTDATADYKDDNVTYKVESFDGVFDSNSSAQIAATPDAEGTYVVKVTATTPNDLFGYTGASTATAANLENDYYVVVKTPKLKAINTTGIALSDKTVVMKKAYASTKGGTADTAIVEITPELTPDTANTTLTWSVTGSNAAYLTNTTHTYYDKDGNAVDVNANNGRFVVTKNGEYTVNVQTANGLTASMKLTVKDNFNDVSKTAYYANAVKWAYTNDITAGTSDTTFGSFNSVTRAQFVTWLYKYAVSKDSAVAIADDDVKSVFSDVPTTAFYAKAVQWAKENGITAGTTATTFSPDQIITRAQAIQMLWVANGRPYAGQGENDEASLKFTDVPSNAYYKTAVTWALQSYPQITAGTSSTTFGPNDPCLRCQAMQFVYSAAGRPSV